MGSEPIISVITISWNSELTIERALKSVEMQEGVPPGALEHWVIDGGSTDETLALVKKHPKVNVISERDHGIADAFSKGYRAARGRWILYLNSDDELFDHHVIRDLLPKLDGAFDFIYGMISIRGIDGELVKTAGRDGAWAHLHQRMTIPHPATFTNRRYFEKYGVFDESFRIAMDYEWILRGYRQSRFLFIPREINRFYTGGVSTAAGGFRQALECYRAKKKNHVGNVLDRLFWLAYQGLRMQFEPALLRLPGIGPILRRLGNSVGRGY